MPHVEKSGEVEFPVEKIYQTVADVEKYPEFLPGIKSVEVNGELVKMTVNMGPATVSWTSKAAYEPNKSISFNLVEGPFKRLDGKWEFTAEGSKTKIKYSTDFELTLPIPGINEIAAKAIESNTNAILEAFKRRLGMN
ncbi:MAG: SRPBCC family protein [Chloroflexi bacterium]|nr:SRPBCC family protein [Chloroflexota bacterium]